MRRGYCITHALKYLPHFLGSILDLVIIQHPWTDNCVREKMDHYLFEQMWIICISNLSLKKIVSTKCWGKHSVGGGRKTYN